MPRRILPILLLLLCALQQLVQAQDDRPNVFIDCNTRCYSIYVKQEMTFVNYIQDRQVADVYILATDQRASGGSREIQFIISGQNRFEGMRDTIQFYREANISESVAREQYLKYLKIGVLPYVVQTSLLDNLEYDIDSDNLNVTNSEALNLDPWKNWSFRINANAWLSGESNFRNANFSGGISGAKITDDIKLRIRSNFNYSQSSFTLSDGEVVSTTIFGNNQNLLYVKSISDHLSIGGELEAGSSTFGNTDFQAAFKPAIEYNIYPYSENSTRRFSLRYAIGPEYFDYTEITIFDKLKETVIRQGLAIEFNQTQNWGEISIFFRAEQFLHDPSLYKIEINPDFEFNIIKGLSLDFGGNVGFIRDRINIAQTEFSDEDIILQAIQLDTNFSYFTYFGFSYRFGTQNNSVVNPRF